MSEIKIGTNIEEELLDWTNKIIKIDWNKSNNKQITNWELDWADGEAYRAIIKKII
jgi:hypothetical protein